MTVDLELALQLFISFVIGTAIGMEREYRSKAAGLRTMIMICVGSTIFTELSTVLGVNSPDRIASNIITGIGFLGAGVIFKDGLTINGITTATTIWITAALGMAVGAGEYFVALVGSVVILIVLAFFENFQKFISRSHQERAYRITLQHDDAFDKKLETELKRLNLRYKKERDMKSMNEFILLYAIRGKENNFDQLNIFLKRTPLVLAFEY
jgi:putative Mg2+ transporter-C (MgtC) family protein